MVVVVEAEEDKVLEEDHVVEIRAEAIGEAEEVVEVVEIGIMVVIKVVMVEVIKEVGEVTAHGKTRIKVKVRRKKNYFTTLL